MNIKDKMIIIEEREKPIIYKKMLKDDDDKSNVIKAKIKEKYKCYICDYCGEEIKIEKDHTKQTGGILEIKNFSRIGDKITLALHNKCLNLALKEINKI